MPPITQVHIDRALTNISVRYGNESYIADKVLPCVPVNKRSDKYFVYRKEDFVPSVQMDVNGKSVFLREPGTRSAEINYQLSTSSYYAEEYAASLIVTDAEVKYADNPLQPDTDATIFLTEQLLMANEVRVANQVMTRANYNTANKVTLTTGASGTSYAQYSSANSNPFVDIKNAKIAIQKGIIREPNRYLMTIDTARTLADHPLVKDLVKYTHMEALTSSGLPLVMRGLQILEGVQQKGTQGEGASYVGGNVWNADNGTAAGLIYYASQSPSLRSISFGWTFEAPDDTTGVRGLAVRKWRDEERKGDKIEVSFMRDYKLIAVDGSGNSIGGYLIDSCTA